MKFRKRPVVIEAEQFSQEGTCDTWPAGVFYDEDEDSFKIKTLEGEHIVSEGDWIITGIKGERYPCKPDIFEATYELLTDYRPAAFSREGITAMTWIISPCPICYHDYNKAEFFFCPNCKRMADEAVARIMSGRRRKMTLEVQAGHEPCASRIVYLERKLALAEDALAVRIRGECCCPGGGCIHLPVDPWVARALTAERQLAEAQAETAHQAREELADIANGHTPVVENPIFDAIAVLQAFKGPLWKERDSLRAKLGQARAALDSWKAFMDIVHDDHGNYPRGWQVELLRARTNADRLTKRALAALDAEEKTVACRCDAIHEAMVDGHPNPGGAEEFRDHYGHYVECPAYRAGKEAGDLQNGRCLEP